MDNQNANAGGFSPNPYDPNSIPTAQGQTAQPTQMNDTIVQPNLTNIQTQSVVESARDAAEREYAEVKARNDAILRQQKVQAVERSAARTAVYIILAVLGVGILVVIGWLVINALIRATPAGQGGGNQGGGNVTKEYPVIDGYQCQTENCKTETAINDKQTLINDNNHYYLVNKADGSSQLTSIDNQAFGSITAFKWSGKDYVILAPQTGEKALFSITDNRSVTDYIYDSFMTTASDTNVYYDMSKEVDKYIVAKASGTNYLISLTDGSVKVSAAKRVFAHGSHFVGYESDGTMFVYLDGDQTAVATVKAGEYAFLRDGYLIIVSGAKLNAITSYDQNGNKVSISKLPFYASSLKGVKNADILAKMQKDKKNYYPLPAL